MKLFVISVILNSIFICVSAYQKFFDTINVVGSISKVYDLDDTGQLIPKEIKEINNKPLLAKTLPQLPSLLLNQELDQNSDNDKNDHHSKNDIKTKNTNNDTNLKNIKESVNEEKAKNIRPLLKEKDKILNSIKLKNEKSPLGVYKITNLYTKINVDDQNPNSNIHEEVKFNIKGKLSKIVRKISLSGTASNFSSFKISSYDIKLKSAFITKNCFDFGKDPTHPYLCAEIDFVEINTKGNLHKKHQ